MKKMLSLILTLALLLAVSAATAEESGEGTWYIYTQNGKALNVRNSPGGEIVGTLECGSEIQVDAFVDNNWALITFRYDQPGFGEGDYAAYINRRFLTRREPSTWVSDLSAESYVAAGAAMDPITEINAEFRSAKKVEPYRVLVRPTRVSGWADLRWAPSHSAEVLAVFRANTELLVLKELTNWLQVQDPATGDIGYINRGFVAQ